MMHCILSGFDPFGTASANPSQQAVERVGDRVTLAGDSEAALHKLVLSTCCDTSWELLREAVAQIPAGDRFGLVMSGFAELREKITPEWCALNVRHYRIADNHGHQPLRESIVSGAPDALTTKVPLEALLKALTDSGLQADISYHAGTFVCNEVYYRALNEWGSDPRCAGIVFIHLPSAGNYQKQLAKEGAVGEPMEHYMTALNAACKLICEAGV